MDGHTRLLTPPPFNTQTHIHLQAEAKEEGEGAAAVDVTVIARAVEKQDYYENGQHF